MNLSIPLLKEVMHDKGYSWFNNSDTNLNIIGIRNHITKNVITDFFDDTLIVVCNVNGSPQLHSWPITTDPGLKGSIHYKNKKGVARLVEGQYRGVYQIGLHKGQYRALVQRGPVTVWRDVNKDTIYDEVRKDTGEFGINIHKAGNNSRVVSNWSEGCQVFKRSMDFNAFMALCEKAAILYGNRFTYTLLNSKDLL